MRKDIHPKYDFVVFEDQSSGERVLTKSTMSSREMITMEDGKEYPLIKVEVSSYSHPHYTGKVKFLDTAGRIDKFNKKFSKFGGK